MYRLIQFKDARQGREWNDPRLDQRLKVIIYALAGFVFDTYGKVVVITHTWRSEDERRAFYKNDPVMAEKVGVHEVWRAIDVRTINMTPQEIAGVLEFLNKHFNYTGKLMTAVYHNVVGFHLHIQVDGDGTTEFKAHPVLEK